MKSFIPTSTITDPTLLSGTPDSHDTEFCTDHLQNKPNQMWLHHGIRCITGLRGDNK